jgi:FkbM family methyltransferase
VRVALALGVVAVVAAVLIVGLGSPRAPLPGVRVLDLPERVQGERQVFATRFGRVVLRSASPLTTRREAHELWLALGRSEATASVAGQLQHLALAPGQGLYAPPYSLRSWSGGEALGFVTAPEDAPIAADEARLADAPDVERVGPAPRTWMLGKLEIVTVTAAQAIGPFEEDAVIYLAHGRGELPGGRPVGPRQLIHVAAGSLVAIVGRPEATLYVFAPARTTVSSILKQGHKRYSQDDEELCLRDFFADRRGGTFLDVGAGHYQRNSTTYYLEEALAWSGVAIDAQAEYAEGYAAHRKHTQFVAALVTDRARGEQAFYRAEAFPEVSSVSRSLTEAQAHDFTDGGAVTERRVRTTTIDAVLDQLGVRALDLVSMDIEEHEPQALAGFDLDRFAPKLVCVEAHEAVRDALWSYFRRHHYVRQDQYLAWDQSNWYFARQ